jgi:hypothetical protein
MHVRQSLCFIALITGLFSLVIAADSQEGLVSASSLIASTRHDPSDLEIKGLVANLPGSSGFISYKALLTLPTVEATVTGDENFAEMHISTVKIKGIYLDVLAKSLHALANADLVTALCTDGYMGIFTHAYIATHKPILVLTINGMPPKEWAHQAHQEDPGPYFFTSENYNPTDHVLAHTERAQVPTNVAALTFANQQSYFAPITSPAQFAKGSPQEAGFAIAKVECIKCHNAGSSGGTKGHSSWSMLSRDATRDPDTFAKRIRDPKSVDTSSVTPPNLNYDTATLAAITAYFKSFPTE